MTGGQAFLEHVNLTVPDADKTAAMLCTVFGWGIRWQGAAINGGHSVHVGDDDTYLAVYSPAADLRDADVNRNRTGHLNHVGIVVSDLGAVESRVRAAGYKPYNHANYEPGRRFYFDDENAIEYEVVSYV